MRTIKKNFFYLMLFSLLALLPAGAVFAQAQPAIATSQTQANVEQTNYGYRYYGYRPYHYYRPYYYNYYRPYYYNYYRPWGYHYYWNYRY